MIWLLVFVALAFGLGAVFGAPYLPILRRDYEPLLELSELRAGETMVDLGSGDGRLLRAAAARGVRGIGYEINPLLYLISLVVCFRYRKLVTIHLGDYWHAKLPAADVVYVFLIARFMERLDRKLSSELVRPTRVVSFVFEIPGRVPTATNRNAFRYDYPATGLPATD